MGRWLVEEFERIPVKSVQKAFKTCGLGLKLDHSEDHLINQAIFDHLLIERKLASTLFVEDYYGEREKLLQKLLSFEENLTFEVHDNTSEEEINEEELILEFNQPEEDEEEDIEDFESISKVRVLDIKESSSINDKLIPPKSAIDGGIIFLFSY